MNRSRTRPWRVGALAAAIALTGLAVGPLSVPTARAAVSLDAATITLGVTTLICPDAIQTPADLTDEAKASCLSIVLPADDLEPLFPPGATIAGYGGTADFDYHVNDGVDLDASISAAERGGGGTCAGDPPACTVGPLPYEWRPAAAVSGITITPTLVVAGYRFGLVTAASATLPGDPIDVTVGPSNVMTVDASGVPDATDIRVYLFRDTSDMTPPVVGVPKATFIVGSQLGGPAPVNLTWAGSDADSGIDHFQVQASRDGAAYADLGGPLVTPNLTTALSAGHSYRFRVQAWDVAGNPSPWAYSAIERLVVAQDNANAISYDGSWTARSSKTASGRTTHASTSAGSTAKLRFHGRAIAWVAPTGSTRGSAKVYIDGTYRATVSLHGSSVPRLIEFSRTWSSVGWHTISLKVVGTRGHPRVDLDAFLVLH